MTVQSPSSRFSGALPTRPSSRVANLVGISELPQAVGHDHHAKRQAGHTLLELRPGSLQSRAPIQHGENRPLTASG